MRECGSNIYFTTILWPPVKGFLAIPGVQGPFIFSIYYNIISGIGSAGAPGAGAPPLFNCARADYIQ